ncbi:MAG: hypothetical protein E7Y34_01255 [Mycoplasma sp.]|nr:hypothetical protein [Mycoplasma sp.]
MKKISSLYNYFYMQFKNKVLFIFLTIITCGLFLIYVYSKKNIMPKNQLTQDTKININVLKLVELIGGFDNIKDIKSEYKKIKIFFNNKKLIQNDKLTKLKNIKGVFLSSESIIVLLTSNFSLALREEILDLKIDWESTN